MMTHIFRLLLILAATVDAGIASAAEAELPRYDHVDPVALNEHALQKMREGDTGTAALLLERAALLAPHDARIRHNRAALRAARAGKPVLPLPTADAPAVSADAALPPFPLWPKQ